MKYLDLPFGASHESKAMWEGVIEKIKRGLVGWKMMYLSKEGRITLVKSTLSNPLIYFLSFTLPQV